MKKVYNSIEMTIETLEMNDVLTASVPTTMGGKDPYSFDVSWDRVS